MKNIKSILVAVVMMFGSLSFAQTNTKVIAIVNKADWCSICKAYAGRTVETFTENNKDNYFQFIVNDITNNETKKTSEPAIAKVGLVKIQEATKGAGVLTFYDQKTKKVLGQVTVANTVEEVATTMKDVRALASK